MKKRFIVSRYPEEVIYEHIYVLNRNTLKKLIIKNNTLKRLGHDLKVQVNNTHYPSLYCLTMKCKNCSFYVELRNGSDYFIKTNMKNSRMISRNLIVPLTRETMNKFECKDYDKLSIIYEVTDE